ncbi:MAG: hypothetical protein KDD70_11820 [Bdellovibrionales bacterium]|nr:hypothetical protein [Bdellovibrionales bacterium]
MPSPHLIQLALVLLLSCAFITPVHAQNYYSLGDGLYCIQFPSGPAELGVHTGGGNVDIGDPDEQKKILAKKAVRLRQKLKAAKNYVKTNGGSSRLFSKLIKIRNPNIEKVKALIKSYNAQLKKIEQLRDLIIDCEESRIDFTGAGNIETLFVFPAPNDFSDRNYNVLYVPLKVQRNKKGKVTTNLKFCLSYIKREDSDSFKLAPFEYIVTFYNDPCLAGRLPGANCSNFFGERDDYGYILTVLNGLGDKQSDSWLNEKLSQITVVTRPMGKEGCLGDSGFRK